MGVKFICQALETTLYSSAVATDSGLQHNCFEWLRQVRRCGTIHAIISCPDDVQTSLDCKHDAIFVRQHCRIPFCNDCFTLALQNKLISRCLAHDDFTGCAHDYLVTNKVTWLEAAIACPVFSGLVTYYVEGNASQRGHMMHEALARTQRARAVQGNICFLPFTLGRGDVSTF